MPGRYRRLPAFEGLCPVNKSTKTFALGRLKSGEMNKTEAAYAQVLEKEKFSGAILWYKFEGITLKLADNTRYTPDFVVMLANGELEVREIKGSLTFMQEDAKVKIKVAAELYPFRFVLLAPRPKKEGGGWNSKVVGNT